MSGMDAHEFAARTLTCDRRAKPITVERASAEDIGLREVFVSLDGESIAILAHGESVTRTVAPGPHEVRVHNTLIRKRIQLDSRAREHARLVAVNRAGRWTFSILALLGAGPCTSRSTASIQPASNQFWYVPGSTFAVR